MSIRAFDLHPLLSEVDIDLSNTQICCLDVLEKSLFLGTNNGLVMHYFLDLVKDDYDDEEYIKCERVNGREIEQGKRISQLHCASIIGSLLLLVDGALIIVNSATIGLVSHLSYKQKNIVCLSVNPAIIGKNPLNVEVCIANRKKQILLLAIGEDKLSVLRQVNVNSVPVALSINGPSLCYAGGEMYKIVDLNSGSQIDLLPHNLQTPFIKRINNEEFLLNGPEALGIFVNCDGISKRPPLTWSETTFAVAYSHPYILALDEEFLTVHSVLDQLQKQTIPSPRWSILGDFEGNIIVGTSLDLLRAAPTSFERQLNGLLDEKREEEALKLIASHLEELDTGVTDAFFRMRERAISKVGLIKLEKKQLAEAFDYLFEGNVDLRLLLTLWPKLLDEAPPSNLKIKPVEEIVDGDDELLNDFDKSLAEFLIRRKKCDAVESTISRLVDECIIRLLARSDNVTRLNCLLSDNKLTCPYPIPSYILSALPPHSLALLHYSCGGYRSALDIWKDLVEEKMTDALFPGIQIVVETLSSNKIPAELASHYFKWLLDLDPLALLQILKIRSSLSEDAISPIEAAEVFREHLDLRLDFLDFIVNERQNSDVGLSEMYAYTCIDYLLSETNEACRIPVRDKFNDLIAQTDKLPFDNLLMYLSNSQLRKEKCQILAKLGQHNEALRIIVETMNDLAYAFYYCKTHTQSLSPSESTKIYDLLLEILLESKKNERFALELINNNQCSLNPSLTVSRLPLKWGVTATAPFLTSALAHNSIKWRISALKRQLAKVVFTKVQGEYQQAQSGLLTLDESRMCAICHRSFFEPSFAVYPNGTIVHVSCMKDATVCPKTGSMFHALNSVT